MEVEAAAEEADVAAEEVAAFPEAGAAEAEDTSHAAAIPAAE